MSRRPIAAFAYLSLAGLLSGTPALATTFNAEALKRHENWQSAVLSLGEERHFRALEADSYSDTVLSLNHTAGVCDLPWLEVRVDLDERQAKDRAVNLVPADFRVDQDTIHNGMAEFITERGDSGFYAQFYLPRQALLIEEMRQGETLRLRFTLEEDERWFLTFTLNGADAAIDRAESLCLAADDPP
ncbi:hypothetical protein [Billgrantia gudaonensis]|uniref:Uncharacterized protein n=1 Tax=Billgrantia gudaonensis TaxID=376427 RepID=A0A1G8PS30_9GAMM|nr:hypothetical protein [Halomonas gudaonensis]SDI95076.1 hypothetical protein SAMN04487954_102171 [Halomonas gudaonensis]